MSPVSIASNSDGELLKGIESLKSEIKQDNEGLRRHRRHDTGANRSALPKPKSTEIDPKQAGRSRIKTII